MPSLLPNLFKTGKGSSSAAQRGCGYRTKWAGPEIRSIRIGRMIKCFPFGWSLYGMRVSARTDFQLVTRNKEPE